MQDRRETPLVERERELETVAALIAQTRAGTGRVALIEGPAGVGKTELLAQAKRRAAEGMDVYSARAGELERALPFGAVRQLFETRLADPAVRERALSGAAQPAQTLFEGSGEESGSFAALHGLYWLALNLAEDRPVLLAIDDLQWCDTPSLRFVAYLARRIEGVPIMIVATRRVTRGDANPAPLADLAGDSATVSLRPAPLTRQGVDTVVRGRLGEAADAAVCAACHEASGGNPLLLRQLLMELEADGVRPSDRAGAVAAAGRRVVMRTVLPRLQRLPADAQRVARAIAVLGDSATLPAVAALSGLAEPAVADATGALVRADILQSEPPLDFVHPLVRDAVYGELTPAERQLQHARAAELLRAVGSSCDHVAAQLLHAPPRGRPWVAELLHDAATDARRRGAAESAVAYLERALAEPPPAARRPALLFDLGMASALTSAPDAIGHLEESYATLDDPRLRARAAHELVRLWCFSDSPARASAVAREAAAELREIDADDRRRLAASQHMAAYIAAAEPTGTEALERYRSGIDAPGVGARMLEATAAYAWMLEGGPADRCAELALRALADGELIEHDDVFVTVLAVGVLTLADREEAMTWWETIRSTAHRRGSLFGALGIHIWTGVTLLCRGDLTEAEALLRQARALNDQWAVAAGRGAAYAGGLLAQTLIERGELAGATAVLRDVPQPTGRSDGENQVRQAVADLAMARGDAEGALAAAEDFATASSHVRNPAAACWRSVRALALARNGRVAEALDDAREEVELARGFGAPRPLGRALRIEGSLRGEAGIALLRQAVDVLDGSPARLEHAKALAALGGALRRVRRPREAREPLRHALEIATACGAGALAEHVRVELRASGARPRTEALQGVGSLTPSERRVASLAADGRTNKEIAQTLYVTPKTVEVHLSSAYRKLGIRSRHELPAVLAVAPTGLVSRAAGGAPSR